MEDINKRKKINNSEIINQKKQFIFEVDQTSDYIFPNEDYQYYIYIKNISGVEISHFNIKIENPSGVIFEQAEKGYHNFTIKPNEVMLYEMTAHCTEVGTHIVHFVGYGEGTQILYETLTINCTRLYNSDTMLHRIHIYDFTPYEEAYSIEADNYSNSVTQTFKRQKLPYEAKNQPFPLQTDFVPENIESESFLDQYNKAKNTKEHVYQYISRENFTQDSSESYEGRNLIELFEKINKESEYFRGKLFRTGTNHLLNDFMQFNPNGFFHRMGLLNSEIYHYLGVLPKYSYMSDRLFRWAPGDEQPLSLIPEKKAMNWNENIWAGQGWMLYRVTTEEYRNSKEYQQKLENNSIVDRERIGDFRDKRTALETVRKLQHLDDLQRVNEKNDLVKYQYELYESLYDTGVFFIHIPIDKIPSNFYLINTQNLYEIINQVKPYGTKPVIDYVIERTFDHHMDFKTSINYYEKPIFELDAPELANYLLKTNKVTKKFMCDNENYPYFALTNPQVFYGFNFDIEHEMEFRRIGYPKIRTSKNFEMDCKQESSVYKIGVDNRLHTLNDVLELINNGNYNTISFKMEPEAYDPFKISEGNFSKNEYDFITLEGHVIDSIKVKKGQEAEYREKEVKINMSIKDIQNKKHIFEMKYDKDLKMDFITYSYVNTNHQEFIRERGYQNIDSLVILIGELQNKKIILFMVEDKERYIHYFHHIIVQDIVDFKATKFLSEEEKDISNYVFSATSIFHKKVIFETPFVKKSQIFQPNILNGGRNWENLFRLNEDSNSYSFIKNIETGFLSPDSISLHYTNINIPETSFIDSLRLTTIGTSSKSNNVYIGNAFNTNYRLEDEGKLQLIPDKIECSIKESPTYYQIKLNMAIDEGEDSLIEEYNTLLTNSIIFDEDMMLNTSYLDNPNDYITINKPFWYEISEFTDLNYNLNDISSINFIIEGYNTGHENDISIESLSNISHSSTVKDKIPSGYFRKKINLLYPNAFFLEILRVRFSFDKLNHDIKVFDTRIEIKFKNQQYEALYYDNIDSFNMKEKNITTLLKDYDNPSDINNGTSIELSFDDLRPGNYYHINKTELEVIYTETDMDMMINEDKYQDIFDGVNISGVSGQIDDDTYLSGMFYNDVPTMMQPDDDISIDNKGIKLQNTIYQMFETRSDNITSIEIFPYGFIGNPDETLKLGLYENSYNTPGKLIKEIYINGWLKNNPQLRNLGRIKYNFNVNSLKVNEKYWFKLQVLNPRENSYYLLKGINNTKPDFKLIANEKNNYINTFSNLKFNIYSKNLSQSFNSIPSLQTYFDNPYVLIGLHKGKGTIQQLQTDKYIESFSGNDYMSELVDNDITINVFECIETKSNGEKIIRKPDGTEEKIEGE